MMQEIASLVTKVTANKHADNQQLLNDGPELYAPYVNDDVGQLLYWGDLWSFLVDRCW